MKIDEKSRNLSKYPSTYDQIPSIVISYSEIRMGNTQQKFSQNPEKAQEEEEENGSTFTCEICIEPISLSNKKFKNQNKCVHPFCLDCIIKYIAVKTQENMSQIRCPALDCDHYFDCLSCKPVIPHQLFDKWSDLLCEYALLGFDRCYCPNRDCSALIVNECGGNVRKSKCPKCNKLFCFSCKIGWHAGYGCEESGELRDGNDIAFGVLAERKNWKRCPTCHHFVELIEGCAIVRCRCGTDFCYNCGRKVNQHWCGCQRIVTCWNLLFRVLLVIVLFSVAASLYLFAEKIGQAF